MSFGQIIGLVQLRPSSGFTNNFGSHEVGKDSWKNKEVGKFSVGNSKIMLVTSNGILKALDYNTNSLISISSFQLQRELSNLRLSYITLSNFSIISQDYYTHATISDGPVHWWWSGYSDWVHYSQLGSILASRTFLKSFLMK